MTHQVPESLISTGTGDLLQPPSLSNSTLLPPPAATIDGAQLHAPSVIAGPTDISTSPVTRFSNYSVRRSSGSAGTPVRSRRESPIQNIPPRVHEGSTNQSPLGTTSTTDPSPSLNASQSPFGDLVLSPPECLIDFAAISEYIIPRSSLSHRLVTCNTERHKIPGFPCVVKNSSYDRNEFRWNLCFVFNRGGGRNMRAGLYSTRDRRDSWDEEGANFSERQEGDGEGEVDLSAFESVVRKCGRILRGCEVRLAQSLACS